jgi:signal transduction histidine kinase
MAPAPGSEGQPADVLRLIEHEVANDATVISGIAHALQRRWDRIDDGERGRLVAQLVRQADQLTVLIRNLRALADDAGDQLAQSLAPQLLPDPAEQLRSIAEDLRPLARDHPLDIAVDAGLPPVRLNLAAFQQVLMNLVANSAKFAPAGSPIALRVRAAGGGLQVDVDDEGPGIPPEHRQAVFGRYVQLRPEAEGAGLGLYVCRRVVEAMGGRIWVEDGGPGARMRCRFPGVAADGVASPAPSGGG